jgi:hypothetical protein
MRAVSIAALSMIIAAGLGCGGGNGNTSNGSLDGGADHSEPGNDGGNKSDSGLKSDGGGGGDATTDGASSDDGSDGGAGDGGDDGGSDGGAMKSEWTIVSTPLDGGVDLYGVGGYTNIDVWAVGGTATTPADIFWAGTAWTDLGLVTTSSPLLSVSSQDPDDSWTVAGSTLLHWAGSGWGTLTMNTNTTPLTSVWAYQPGQAFAVGNAGTILNCTTASANCTSVSAGSADLNGVWALDANHAWTVGKGGAIYSFDGTTPTAETGAVTTDLHAVGGSEISDVWAVGDAIEHGPGTWKKDAFTPPGTLYGVWAAAANEAWAVGKGGIILAWDGKHWKKTASPTTSDLYAIWGNNDHDIWAVGANNTALHRLK